MTMLEVIPQEFFDGVPAPAAVSLDGELLGALVDLPAGAWLAQTLESVDPCRLTTFELPVYLSVARKVAAWAASCVDSGVAELATRRDEGVAADVEAAFALQEPLQVAQKRVHRALRLRALLPTFKRAFSHGDLSEFDVSNLVEATQHCDDLELLARVQEDTLRNAGAKTAGELRRYARRLLERLEPEAATRRAKTARAQAEVRLHPREDGMGSVVTDQPIADAAIVKAACDAKAIRAKQAGDPRPIGVLRAAGLTELCSDYLNGSTGAARPTVNGRPIEIGIVVGLRTMLGHNDLLGEIPDAGIVPRDVIAAMVAAEQPRLRLLVVDDDPGGTNYGRLVYRAHDSYRPTPDQVAHVRAKFPTSLGPGSKVRAERCDTDHFREWPSGDTIETNLGPLDRPWHNRKTRGAMSVTVDDTGAVSLTTVLGQSRTVTGYDYSPHLDCPTAGQPQRTADKPAPF